MVAAGDNCHHCQRQRREEDLRQYQKRQSLSALGQLCRASHHLRRCPGISPFLAAQILWINVVAEEFIGLALEPFTDIMKESPVIPRNPCLRPDDLHLERHCSRNPGDVHNNPAIES